MNTESIQEKEVTNTLSAEFNPPISTKEAQTPEPSEAPITPPLDSMLTSQDVCDLLKINRHTLSTNRKIWADILPPIRFKGSNLIRYRRSDVQKLVEGDSTSSSHEME